MPHPPRGEANKNHVQGQPALTSESEVRGQEVRASDWQLVAMRSCFLYKTGVGQATGKGYNKLGRTLKRSLKNREDVTDAVHMRIDLE